MRVRKLNRSCENSIACVASSAIQLSRLISLWSTAQSIINVVAESRQKFSRIGPCHTYVNALTQRTNGGSRALLTRFASYAVRSEEWA